MDINKLEWIAYLKKTRQEQSNPYTSWKIREEDSVSLDQLSAEIAWHIEDYGEGYKNDMKIYNRIIQSRQIARTARADVKALELEFERYEDEQHKVYQRLLLWNSILVVVLGVLAGYIVKISGGI